jgi:protein SCO1/2
MSLGASLAFAALLALPGCGKSSAASSLPSGARTYEMRGRVIEFAPGGETVTIAHEEVAGFMPAMVMPFYIKDPAVLGGIKPGDAVSFRFVVTEKDSWIDRTSPIGDANVAVPAAAPARQPEHPIAPRLREGDRLPEFKLINQDGETVTTESLRGQPLILTFIFTRCPVPNFCPLMTSRFEELQRALAPPPGPRARLLSISFDTDFDTPEVLKAYGAAHGADSARWTIASAARDEMAKLTAAFAVYVKPEGGTLSHGLCTALVDSDGRIVGLWRGNGWSTDEVLQKLASLKPAAP